MPLINIHVLSRMIIGVGSGGPRGAKAPLTFNLGGGGGSPHTLFLSIFMNKIIIIGE